MIEVPLEDVLINPRGLIQLIALMIPKRVLTVEDAARCLPDLVDRVHASGESALLLKSGKPVARIVSVPDGAGGSGALITFLRQWRIEHPEPDEQFGEAIDESRKIAQPPHDPWE